MYGRTGTKSRDKGLDRGSEGVDINKSRLNQKYK
jgi:hypothetical protein